jgi:uncharacterized protein with PIN domain
MMEIRFMVDHMLIKLGKYLRIIGYDAAWDSQVRTHELITKANTEDRIFLTRNTHITEQYPRATRLLVLRETDPVKQFQIVVAEFRLDPRERLFSKCIRCNLFLEKINDKEQIRARVHPNVYARFEAFFTCPKCGTVFWKGTHVANTCRKLELPRPGPNA